MPKRVSKETHQAQKMRYNKRSRAHAFNSYSPWTEPQVGMVLDHHYPDSVLSKKIGRSIQAIQLCRNRRQ